MLLLELSVCVSYSRVASTALGGLRPLAGGVLPVAVFMAYVLSTTNVPAAATSYLPLSPLEAAR